MWQVARASLDGMGDSSHTLGQWCGGGSGSVGAGPEWHSGQRGRGTGSGLLLQWSPALLFPRTPHGGSWPLSWSWGLAWISAPVESDNSIFYVRLCSKVHLTVVHVFHVFVLQSIRWSRAKAQRQPLLSLPWEWRGAAVGSRTLRLPPCALPSPPVQQRQQEKELKLGTACVS